MHFLVDFRYAYVFSVEMLLVAFSQGMKKIPRRLALLRKQILV